MSVETVVMGVHPPIQTVSQDLDLIDVLWRQDIDLGVGREVYDLNLRKELEKEQEVALKKEEEQKDLTEPQSDEQESTETTTFIIDGETGELVPAPDAVTPVQGQSTVTPVQPVTLGEEEGFSVEEAMRLLESSAASDPIVPQGSLPQPMNVSTTLGTNNATYQQDIETMIQNAANFQVHNTQGPSFVRQTSFEQRWQDVASLLDMPPNSHATNTSGNQINMTDMMANNLNNITQHALLNNASLAPAASQTSSFASELSAAINIGGELQGYQQPPSLNTQLSLTNMSAVMPPMGLGGIQNSSFINSSETLLHQLLSDEIQDIDFADLNITENMQPMQIDDSASDSAVSSMSSASPQNTPNSPNDLLELQSNISSPYEGLEGATGGSEQQAATPKYTPTKFEKYDLEYSYPEYSVDSDGGFGNFSSSSNDTEYAASAEANPRQVAHNHTYPLQPGQSPKERKADKVKREQEEDEMQLAYNRDIRKAKALKIPMSVDEIIHTPVETFNELLQKYTLTDPQLQLIRDIRRRGKNKVAAQNCRKRKLEVIQSLEDEVQKMRQERDRLASHRRLLDKEARDMREKYDNMYAEVFRSLRDEDGHPYDPEEYSLQQTSDGNVFLVPRNTTSNVKDEHKDKPTRKRKAGRKDR